MTDITNIKDAINYMFSDIAAPLFVGLAAGLFLRAAITFLRAAITISIVLLVALALLGVASLDAAQLAVVRDWLPTSGEWTAMLDTVIKSPLAPPAVVGLAGGVILHELIRHRRHPA